MKRTIVLICLIFNGLCAFSQEFNQELVIKATDDFCTCMTEKLPADFEVEDYFNIFGTGSCIHIFNTEAFFSLFIEYLDTDSELSEEEQGEIIGKKFFSEVNSMLPERCDVAYKAYEKIKLETIDLTKETFNFPEDSEEYKRINEELETNPDSYSYKQRGLIHYWQGKLDAAEADFKKSHELKTIVNEQQLIVFAYILEQNGKYDEVIALYENALKNGADPNLVPFLAIAKRKKREIEAKKE